MSTQTLKCRICNHIGLHENFTVREMMYGTRREFEYFQCSNCGCLQILDIPDDMSEYYPADYYSFSNSTRAPQDTPAIRRHLEKWITRPALFGRGYKLAKVARQFIKPPAALFSVERLLKHCKAKSFDAAFLDVGCGSQSWWLNDLQSLGFKNLTGIDPFIASDHNGNGINIRKGRLADLKGKFDVISMHHSLEHAPDQISMLSAAKNLLNPDGCCLVRIPLVSSLAWETYKTHWAELDAPRHLFLHSTQSIATAGTKAGLALCHHFWDSESFEFWGSEQYLRNIPLKSPTSFSVNPDNSSFTYKEMAAFRDKAIEVNSNGQGGRGVFYFFRA
jgi:SAM-dependent methyltransferase